MPADTNILGQTHNRVHVQRARSNYPGVSEGRRVNWSREFALKEVTPQMIRRASLTLETSPNLMSVFFRLRAGRRCSCWGKGETPDGYCVSCYHTGHVGGFEKFGTKTAMLEATKPGVTLMGVARDFGMGVSPVPFRLAKEAKRGIVEASIDIAPNAGVLDLFRVHAEARPGAKVEVFVKRPIEKDFVLATKDHIEERLQAGTLILRVVLSRDSLEIPAPYLKAVRLRYQILKNATLVPFNTVIGEGSFQAGETGIVESFSTQSFFSDNTLKSLANEDALYEYRTNQRWKVINFKKFNPVAGITVSWLVAARLVQENDSFYDFEL